MLGISYLDYATEQHVSVAQGFEYLVHVTADHYGVKFDRREETADTNCSDFYSQKLSSSRRYD